MNRERGLDFRGREDLYSFDVERGVYKCNCISQVHRY